MTTDCHRVLVTGATGFLGNRLCQRLQEAQHRVVALGRHRQAGPWEAFHEADLTREILPGKVMEGIQTVYHLASRAHAVSDTPEDNGLYRQVIVDGTRRLVEAARQAGVERFVYMSSVKAMGEGNPVNLPLSPMDEAWPHTPQGPYGRAKLQAEGLVLESGIPHAVVLRPVMVFGPGEKGNLPRMIEAVRRGRFPPLPETGNRRSMIHLDDVVAFTLRAASLPAARGNRYILASREAVSTRELYEAIRLHLGLRPLKGSVPLWMLQAAAACGSLLGALAGRRLPLDRETLRKLTGSAWYSAARAEADLEYRAAVEVTEWLKPDNAPNR